MDKAMEHIPNGMVSSVNLAEVYSKTHDLKMTLDGMKWAVDTLRLTHVPFTNDDAMVVGAMREPTRKAGISLGDRACLALGISRRVPIITAEKRWIELGLDADIRLIR